MDASSRQVGFKYCGTCAALAGMPSDPPRGGRVLRHWTTNALEISGKTTMAGNDSADWGLAESRRFNLVVSRLQSLASGVGAL